MHSVPASLKSLFCPSQCEHFEAEIGLYFGGFKGTKAMMQLEENREKNNQRSVPHAHSSLLPVLRKPER